MPMTPRRRTIALLAPILCLLAAAFALPAAASGSSHPYFDDQGTLTWHHDFDSARRAAQREGKLIFIEYGRRICTQCKVLCARVLPHPSIRGRIRRVAVGLVAECDRPEPAVQQLFRRHLRGARMLPFVGIVTPEGRWVTGFSGRTSVSQLSGHLALAERALAGRTAARTRAESRRRRVACPPKPAPVRKPKPACTPPKAPDDDCCPDGTCAPGHRPHIKFRMPGTRAKSAPCPPCPPKTPDEPAAAPRAPVAEAPPAPAPTFPPPCPLPDEPSSADLAGAPPTERPRSQQGALPAPHVRPSRPYPGARRRPMTGYGDPDGDPPSGPAHERFVPPTQNARAAALAAAERGAWGDVIRQTRVRASTDPEMRSLNYRAHAWAHGRLAEAVQSLRERRYSEARAAVSQVQRAMQGEPEAVDANRGAEAIELMQDLQHLAEESAVRRTVRKNAYEKMRGSRWAPLFSDCPQPSMALSSR